MAYMNRIHPCTLQVAWHATPATNYSQTEILLRITSRQWNTNWNVRNYSKWTKSRGLLQMKKLEDIEVNYSKWIALQHQPKYKQRFGKNEETVEIPLESLTTLQDPRKHSCKLPIVFQHTEEPEKKTWKLCEESSSSTSRSTTSTTNEDTTKKILQQRLKELSCMSQKVIWNYSQQALLIPIKPVFKKIVLKSKKQV